MWVQAIFFLYFFVWYTALASPEAATQNPDPTQIIHHVLVFFWGLYCRLSGTKSFTPCSEKPHMSWVQSVVMHLQPCNLVNQQAQDVAYRNQLCSSQVSILIGIKECKYNLQRRITQVALHHFLYSPLQVPAA